MLLLLTYNSMWQTPRLVHLLEKKNKSNNNNIEFTEATSVKLIDDISKLIIFHYYPVFSPSANECAL